MQINIDIKDLLKNKKKSQIAEELIVDGCRKNNRKIQKQLYDRYCDAMFAVAYRIVNNYDVANDALQEAFIQVFKDIKQFKGNSTLGAWIKTIVVRTSIKKIKKENTFTQLDIKQNGEMISWPEEMRGADLEKAILALADGCRAIFLLIEVEGYKHKEVAEMLDISEGTSKSQLHYAKKQLQLLLKDYINR